MSNQSMTHEEVTEACRLSFNYGLRAAADAVRAAKASSFALEAFRRDPKSALEIMARALDAKAK